MAHHRAELIDFVVTRLVAGMAAPAEWKTAYLTELARAVRETQLLSSSDCADKAATDSRELADLLKTILNNVARSDKHSEMSKPALGTLVSSIARAELNFRDRFEGLVKTEGTTAPAKTARAQTRMTAENITTYLRTRFADMPDIGATAVTPIPGGRSKGTTLVKLEGHASFPAGIVLRQDLAAEIGGQSVVYEYPLQEIAWRAGLPLPKPLWLEPNHTMLGGPFSALAMAAGKPGGTLFRMDAPASVARDAARFFGQLHSLDLETDDLRARLMWGQSSTPVRDMLDSYYAKWRTSEIEPSPLVEASFLWLHDHVDVTVRQSVLVHGDSSYHNMLVHGGRLSAVLDWEFAHAGDPAEDLLGSEHFTTQVLPWTEFMRVYRDNGGREISDERFRFFALWRSLRFAIATAVAGHAFATGTDGDLRLAAIGYNSFPRLLHDVARQLAAATAPIGSSHKKRG